MSGNPDKQEDCVTGIARSSTNAAEDECKIKPDDRNSQLVIDGIRNPLYETIIDQRNDAKNGPAHQDGHGKIVEPHTFSDSGFRVCLNATNVSIRSGAKYLGCTKNISNLGLRHHAEAKSLSQDECQDNPIYESTFPRTHALMDNPTYETYTGTCSPWTPRSYAQITRPFQRQTIPTCMV